MTPGLLSAVVKTPPDNLWIMAVLTPLFLLLVVIGMVAFIFCQRNRVIFKTGPFRTFKERSKVTPSPCFFSTSLTSNFFHFNIVFISSLIRIQKKHFGLKSLPLVRKMQPCRGGAHPFIFLLHNPPAPPTPTPPPPFPQSLLIKHAAKTNRPR